jgi:SAM-dependent methyltransferase
MQIEYNKANLYAKLNISGTGYLAFRDIPDLIKKYGKGSITLDFGCGTGRSSRFLKSLNLIVDGVDKSQAMIDQARKFDTSCSYKIIQDSKIPSKSNYYDIVFSSFVLFEISTKNELLEVFQEIYRVLKDGGVFIAVTGSTEMYKHEWLSLDIDYEENKNLKSGSKAKILLKDIGLELYDYFWTDDDYQNIIKLSKFSLLDQIYPLGEKDDPYNWISEDKFPPYVIYVMQKS